MWGWHGGDFTWWMWIVGPLMMILFWGGLVWLLLALARGSWPVQSSRRESAIEIARRRFAAGEISEQEYEHLIARLAPSRTGDKTRDTRPD